jgi:thioredoxin reductase/polyferredoxin
MMGFYHWLHGRWPAGTVEPLPEVADDGTTRVPGLRIVGDLTGIPLLKFAVDGGARAVRAIAREPEIAEISKARAPEGSGAGSAAGPGAGAEGEPLDLVIVGGGVSGISAAIEARRLGLRFVVLESARPFATIAAFPVGKPIFAYPTEMQPAGELPLRAHVKEALLEDLERARRAAGVATVNAHAERVERTGSGDTARLVVHARDPSGTARRFVARRVIVAIGRSGNHRRLGVPGEDLGHVSSRLHDPSEYAGRDVVVVGGGDSALEAAIALAEAGARVVLSYRKAVLVRPRPENVARLEALSGAEGPLRLRLGTRVRAITETHVELEGDGGEPRVPAQAVFTMIGREAPLAFFRRSGVPIRGEWRASTWAGLVLSLAFCSFVYVWKSGGALTRTFEARGWFPFGVPQWLAGIASSARDPSTLLGTLAISMREPGFYYSFAYTVAVVLFGIARIRRRRTPYVTVQTTSLALVQILPLFLLPYVLLPWLGHAGAFDHGFWNHVADELFPVVSYGHGREYWRAFGFVLAWPLFVWNFYTNEPMTWWLVIGLVQTFVIVPLVVRRWGKGAYCGWICSCGALAETMGDTQRHKMPHGPAWNRLNLVGQVVLGGAFVLFVARIVSWTWPRSGIGKAAAEFFSTALYDFSVLGVQLDYYHLVDVFLAGILGVGLYFVASGRVWCRFACPLAALMHIYARFTRFRIFADKKKCISCNVCTSVCHQGIDVMGFAQRGAPMEDPQCVRCSACVQSCPTGTLTFGRLGPGGVPVADALAASPVQMREAKRRLPLAA